MGRKFQIFAIVFITVLSILLLSLHTTYAKPKLKLGLRIIPNIRTIHIGSEIDKITLIVRVNLEGINFKWNLIGPGAIEGDSTSRKIYYIPPHRLAGKSAKVVITVTIADNTGDTVTENIVFILTEPPPTVIPTPVPLAPSPVPERTPFSQQSGHIAQLLAKADTYFKYTFFILPKEGNAFDTYKEVLSTDPANRHAKAKIREMAALYRKWGDSFYEEKDYSKAYKYYQRYLVVADYVLTGLGERHIEAEFQLVTKHVDELIRISPPTPLRNTPLTVSIDDAQKLFGVDEDQRPRKDIENYFEDRGDVIIDYATGLMWQQSGSDRWLTYEGTQAYIETLNRQWFAGYNDWRLPTIEELMSLLEPERQSNGLYINPLFAVEQIWCWSTDRRSSGSVWRVNFLFGTVYWSLVKSTGDIRGVRSWALTPTPSPITTPTQELIPFTSSERLEQLQQALSKNLTRYKNLIKQEKKGVNIQDQIIPILKDIIRLLKNIELLYKQSKDSEMSQSLHQTQDIVKSFEKELSDRSSFKSIEPIVTISTSKNDFNDYTVFHTSRIYLNLKVKQPIKRLRVDWGYDNGKLVETLDIKEFQEKDEEWYYYSIQYKYSTLGKKRIEVKIAFEDGKEYRVIKKITISAF